MSEPSDYQALVSSLSQERLRKYLEASDNNPRNTILLYESNMRLSEAFYTPLQCLEVCLRNKIHRSISPTYGDDWYQNQNLHLAETQLSKIRGALDELRRNKKPASPGAVVAELSFGFWVGLLGRHYDATLWRRAIAGAFRKHARGIKRDVIHGRMNMLRRFRNRVAHHEPIFQKDLLGVHHDLIDAVAWMCPDTAAWVDRTSRLRAVINSSN